MKQTQFLQVVPADAARARWRDALGALAPRVETVPLGAALGRVLAAHVRAPGNVPAFDRALLDGYALRAEDTWGAEEHAPVRLALRGPEIAAGRSTLRTLEPGQAIPVATGALLPRGADAVVPVEDTVVADGSVLLTRARIAGAGIGRAGADIARGETVLRRGTRLGARETGIIAALGLDAVEVVASVRVGVLSTGDEVVAPGSELAPGEVHDANATLITHALRELGAEAEDLGIAPDDADRIEALIADGLERFDVLLLSGGTSKGAGDLSYRALAARAQIVVHGVALKPGKPLCLGVYEGKPVAVLPGFPTSAIFTFHAFIAPVIRRLLGLREASDARSTARLSRHVASAIGREEFTLVQLLPGRSGLLAVPLGKGSGSVTTFAAADAFFSLPADVEYADAGELVEVTRLREVAELPALTIVGSHCTGLDILLEALPAEATPVRVLSVGSGGGLAAAAEGACDLAPIHLRDEADGGWNASFVPADCRLVTGYGRRQGLAYRPEDADRLPGAPDDVDPAATTEALRAVAGDGELRLAGRNAGSGTHALLAAFLAAEDLGNPPGFTSTYPSHSGVAAAIAQGRADWGICLEQAARAEGLAWRPWQSERYDFVVPEARADTQAVRAFVAVLEDEGIRARLRAEGFEA